LVADTPANVLLPVANTTDSDVVLSEGSPLAHLENVEVQTAPADSAENENEQYEHLKPVWESMGDALPDSDRGALDQLLKEYSSVFSKGETDLGCATAVTHRIDTGDARPFRQALRRQPIAWQEEIDRQLQQLQEQCLIYPVQSEWASNIVVVKKRWHPTLLCRLPAVERAHTEGHLSTAAHRRVFRRFVWRLHLLLFRLKVGISSSTNGAT